MRRLCFLLLPAYALALDVEPWLGELWEFHFIPAYTYDRYPSVQNGHPQLKSASNDHVVALGLGTACTPTSAFDVEMEFADTPRQSMGYRSAAGQYRYQWTNDSAGDAASFTTGFNVRGVSRHSLKDVSCPYASDINIEGTGALGKEWDHGSAWLVRAFGFGALGIANHGSPWMRFLFSIDGTQECRHRYGLYCLGYFGFGAKTVVRTNHFHGWGSIRHQSVDVGVKYSYLFDIWGSLTVAYTRRVFAQSYPQDVNFFTISYSLPFSFI